MSLQLLTDASPKTVTYSRPQKRPFIWLQSTTFQSPFYDIPDRESISLLIFLLLATQVLAFHFCPNCSTIFCYMLDIMHFVSMINNKNMSYMSDIQTAAFQVYNKYSLLPC